MTNAETTALELSACERSGLSPKVSTELSCKSSRLAAPSVARVVLSSAFVVSSTVLSWYLLLSGAGQGLERISLWLIAVSSAGLSLLLAMSLVAAVVFRRRDE
jgi:hypothetical protein